jgi:putative transposase
MDKNLTHDRTCVHNIGYHIVWSTKYRKQVIKSSIETELKKILLNIADEKGFIIKYMEVMPDHIHVFASAAPKISPSYIYKMLKGISARKLFLKFPKLQSQLWKGHLWNPSTYIETVGHVSEDVIKKYIEDQKQK